MPITCAEWTNTNDLIATQGEADCGRSYYIEVVAVDAFGNQSPVATLTDDVPPSIVSPVEIAMTLTPGDGQFTVDWTADPDGADLWLAVVAWTDGSDVGSDTVAPGTLTYTRTGANNDSEYTVNLYFIDCNNNASDALVDTVTPTAALFNFPFTDDFNRADGVPGTPPGTTLEWEESPSVGTFEVNGNGIVNMTGASVGNLVVDYGTANQIAQAVFHGDTGGANAGIVVNWGSQNNYVRAVHQDSDDTLYLQANIDGGGFTTWDSVGGLGDIDGKTIRVEVLDHVYRVYEDDVLLIEYEDLTAHFTTGGGMTKAGIHINGFINIRADDFFGDIPTAPSYDALIATMSPTYGYWPMRETSGTTIADLSGSGNDLTASQTIVGDGDSILFDGNQDATRALTFTSALHTPKTMIIWYKITSRDDTLAMMMWRTPGGGDAGGLFFNFAGDDGDYALYCAGGARFDPSVNTYNDGEWHMLAFVHDISWDWWLYHDGAVVRNGGGDVFGAQNSTNLFVGSNDGIQKFIGFLKKASIHDALLSDTDIADLWAAGQVTPAAGDTYRDTVLADNPTVYLEMQEAAAATVAVDSSGNGHDSNAYNSAHVTSGQPGPGSQLAYDFDGTGGVTVPANAAFAQPLDGTGRFTVEMWVKTTDGNAGLFNQDSGGGSTRPFQEYIAGNFWYAYPNNQAGPAQNSQVVMNDGSWHHLVATMNDSNDHVTFYVDGVLAHIATGSGAWHDGTTVDLVFGSLPGFSDLVGSMAHVALYYGLELTWDRVAAHYAAMFA